MPQPEPQGTAEPDTGALRIVARAGGSWAGSATPDQLARPCTFEMVERAVDGDPPATATRWTADLPVRGRPAATLPADAVVAPVPAVAGIVTTGGVRTEDHLGRPFLATREHLRVLDAVTGPVALEDLGVASPAAVDTADLPRLVAELVAADLLTTVDPAADAGEDAVVPVPHSDPVAPPGALDRLAARARDAYRLSSRLRPLRNLVDRAIGRPAEVPDTGPGLALGTDRSAVARRVLGHVLAYLERDLGLPASEVVDRLDALVRTRPAAHPLLTWTVVNLDTTGAPAVGWHACLEDVRGWAVETLGVPPSTALDTVLTVQRAALPSPGRTYPATLAVAHDYTTYLRTPGVRLDALGPGRFTVPADPAVRADRDHAPTELGADDSAGPAGPAPTGLDELDREGFMVVDLLDAATLAALSAQVDGLGLPDDHDFFVTVAHAWGPTAREFDLACRPVVAAAVERAVPGFAAFLVAATTKGRWSDKPVKFHQDWTYTDERSVPTVFLWCPLTDVDAETGCLHVVPGSHRWHPYLRAARTLEATEHLQAELAARSRPVPLRAGQAVAFFPGTVHGSGPNRSGDRRPALTIATTRPGTPLVHFHLADDGTVTGHEVTDEFFTTNPYGQVPVGATGVDPWDRVVTQGDFVATMALRPAPH